MIAYEVSSDSDRDLKQNLKSQPHLGKCNQHWKMQPTEDGLLPDHTIVLQGTAVKAQRDVKFLFGFRLLLTYYCGKFVGEASKGIVQSGKTSEVEMTFPFDRLFGDGELSPEDSLNKDDYQLVKNTIRQSLALRDRRISSCGRG